MKTLDAIKKVLIRELGLAPCFGSKSGYRESHPRSKPLFNANIYVMISNDFEDSSCLGELRSCWFGDLDLANEETCSLLEKIALENQISLYLYSESTKNNAIFNGRMFPYNDYEAKVEYWNANNCELTIK